MIGSRIGVKIRMAGPISINAPIINKKTVMTNRITSLLAEIPRIISLSAAGILVIDIEKDIAEEVASRNMMTPVITTVWSKIEGKSLIFSVR